MNEHDRAVCGLDCHACPITRATYDANAAGLLLGWFKEMSVIRRSEGLEELMERGPYCEGCRGSRSTHWSPDCYILQCCVDKKGLTSCHLCDEFPCDYITHWAAQEVKYAEALQYLVDLQAAAQA